MLLSGEARKPHETTSSLSDWHSARAGVAGAAEQGRDGRERRLLSATASFLWATAAPCLIEWCSVVEDSWIRSAHSASCGPPASTLRAGRAQAKLQKLSDASDRPLVHTASLCFALIGGFTIYGRPMCLPSVSSSPLRHARIAHHQRPSLRTHYHPPPPLASRCA